jgi:transcriptional regulator of arginine metabolism
MACIMQKKDRQNALLSLINLRAIGSQGELASRLCDQGFSVTQASVSRDLDELGIVKLNGQYVLPRESGSESEFGKVSLDKAGDNLIVGRCASGLASAITVKIDGAHIPHIVGTIAGDDTIFIAVKSAEGQAAVVQKISEMFGQ